MTPFGDLLRLKIWQFQMKKAPVLRAGQGKILFYLTSRSCFVLNVMLGKTSQCNDSPKSEQILVAECILLIISYVLLYKSDENLNIKRHCLKFHYF
jgi:hypothetical protein